MQTENTLLKLRKLAANVTLVLNALLFVALLFATFMYKTSSHNHIIISLAFLVGGAFMVFKRPTHFYTALVMATTTVVMISDLVYIAGLGIYQIDMHMFYFSLLAIFTLFLNWRVMVYMAGLIALHHLLFNFLLPSYIFPDGADFGRVLIHAVAVVLETCVLGYLAYYLEKMLTRLSVATDKIANAVENLDLRIALESEGVDESANLSKELNAFFETTRDVLKQIHGAFDKVSVNASSISSLSVDLSDMSADQKSGISQLHEAIDSSTISINEINELARDSSQGVHRVAKMSEQAHTHMREVTKSADEISDVTQVIMDISDQINLLSLNASIEAARAGEAGRGFAVVAGEVKKLAEDTNNSISKIQKVVEGLHTNVKETTGVVESISSAAANMNEQMDQVSNSVEQQSAAIEEISATASNFLQRIEGVDETIQQTSDATTSLETQRKDVEEQLMRFKV